MEKNEEALKLKMLLLGLEVENIDLLLNKADAETYSMLGKKIAQRIKDIVAERDRLKAQLATAVEALEKAEKKVS